MIVKCNNKTCPIKDKCKRFLAKDVFKENKVNTFNYEPVKNKEGVVVGYTCQFQLFV